MSVEVPFDCGPSLEIAQERLNLEYAAITIKLVFEREVRHEKLNHYTSYRMFDKSCGERLPSFYSEP